MQTTSRLVKSNEGTPVGMMGIQMLVKQDRDGSKGLLSLIVQEVAPGAGSPPHACSGEDKLIYVLEGEFTILMGEDNHQASRDDLAIIGRGTTHRFLNAGSAAGKLLVLLTPGGHENFLKDLSSTVQAHGKDPAKMKEAAGRHGVDLKI